MNVRGVSTRAISLGVLLVGVALIAILAPQRPDLPMARSYKVLSDKDFSTHGRTRLGRGLQSSARSMEERSQTAMQAALDLQKSSRADVVSVWLEINQDLAATGRQLVIVRYAPDGKGFSGKQNWQWEVEATDQEVGPLNAEIGDLWFQFQEDYRDENGVLDEVGLKSFMAQKLGVNANQVTLPWIARKVY